MCGLAGAVGRGRSIALAEVGAQMARVLVHRGPDDQGVWTDEEAGVVLAHRRLAIQDLSPAGHQPMVSADGAWVLAFNGEIYNHQEIRAELDEQAGPQAWRGSSDTETLLAGFCRWGVEATLRRSVGMFALAVWNRSHRMLTLARDRLGEKPLYYCRHGGVFLFGSELKALKVHPAFVGAVDPDAVAALLAHHYVPTPRSIYQDVCKLPPGTILELREGAPSLRTYWSLAQAVEDGRERPFTVGDTAAVDGLEEVLGNAVSAQLLSDVPLGAFLSGGVDSSTVAALMQARGPRPAKTFTVGFEDADFNETAHARSVAAHLGTDHTEHFVTEADALAAIHRLPAMFCEPFADSSQIPTYLISAVARRQVSVALSGDGGDELFGGYDRYGMAQMSGAVLGTPLPLRRLAIGGIGLLSREVLERLLETAVSRGPAGLRVANIADKLEKVRAVIGSRGEAGLSRALVQHTAEAAEFVPGSREAPFGEWARLPEGGSFTERLMTLDLATYLPDDILTKIDRTAMAVSLEGRAPLLDHRVVEFALRLPLNLKIRGGVRKWALREVLHRHVPRDLIERPKMGFVPPLGRWLRGPLKAWAAELLDVRALRQEGLFDAARVQRLWEEHISGQRGRQYQLWPILMYRAWAQAGH